jgi:hypothetical protein
VDRAVVPEWHWPGGGAKSLVTVQQFKKGMRAIGATGQTMNATIAGTVLKKARMENLEKGALSSNGLDPPANTTNVTFDLVMQMDAECTKRKPKRKSVYRVGSERSKRSGLSNLFCALKRTYYRDDNRPISEAEWQSMPTTRRYLCEYVGGHWFPRPTRLVFNHDDCGVYIRRGSDPEKAKTTTEYCLGSLFNTGAYAAWKKAQPKDMSGGVSMTMRHMNMSNVDGDHGDFCLVIPCCSDKELPNGKVGRPAVMCTTFSPVNRIVIWNQCVAASLRQSFVVHITEMLPSRRC